MKLQISNLEALERLIGGDTEIEIELRSAIVQDFSKRYLKNLSVDPILNKIGSDLREEFVSSLFERYKQFGAFYNTLSLHNDGLQIIQMHIQKALDEYLSKVISEEISKHQIETKIARLIHEATEKIADSLSNKILEDRINFLVDERLKSAVGIKS